MPEPAECAAQWPVKETCATCIAPMSAGYDVNIDDYD